MKDWENYKISWKEKWVHINSLKKPSSIAKQYFPIKIPATPRISPMIPAFFKELNLFKP